MVDSSKIIIMLILILKINVFFFPRWAAATNQKVFREYIGAEDKNVSFWDIPINPETDFHFILSFAIDYTNSLIAYPTNGNFRVYWDEQNLNPSHVSSIKSKHPNVKVALSLGGDTINDGQFVYFNPTSITSWVENAIYSISSIVKEYHLDGIDIDYEHFMSSTDPNTFAECIGQLLVHLKQHDIISFASIAPYQDDTIQEYYGTLWRRYGDLIDYVNFQFYAYEKGTNVSQFMTYFETQSKIYQGSNLLVSFGTDDDSGGLKPENGFFVACNMLKNQGKLHGIFIWSADDSKKDCFRYEEQAQILLVN
ncbi:chitinase 2-like [Impatiens glandulifera]|uniref:chitinase 2-like n=1 Tax=Impatiens glandulifera TaxID=253017 RepID=UPI001FB149CF|nr:chitinase 2-like [Impatiens glandulifera]